MTSTALTPDEIKLEMRRRLRRYFVSVVLYLLAVVALSIAVPALMKLAGAGKEAFGVAVNVVGALAMLAAVGLSWRQVYRLWRCPACDGNAFWVVSWNTSMFARRAKKSCPHCGVALFDETSARRTVRFFVIIIVLSMMGGFAASFALTSRRLPPPQTPAPQSPESP